MIVTELERLRAVDAATNMNDAVTNGIGGAESFGTILPDGTAFSEEAEREVRRLTYALARSFLKVEDWKRPNFLNSWTDFNTATHMAVGYMKDPFGFVRLRGLIKRTVAGYASIPMFNLPEGYRPVSSSNFAVVGNNQFARLEVYANGDVAIVAAVSATPEGFVSLDGVSFDTRS